ncbi:MAG: hypothetical protein PHD43_00840 [Methylococcales bacterium]|nr:hypothetical protein [Methylococcales bacterium]
MDENTEIDISEYYKTPLASLTLPDNYVKLIQGITRVSGLNNSFGEKFIAETVGDIFELKPYQFSQCPGFGGTYVGTLIETLIEFKKELPSILNDSSTIIKTPQLIKKSLRKRKLGTEQLPPQITLSKAQLETQLNTLALSTQYQKLIKRISVVMDNIKTVQDIIDIDVTNFSKLPGVGKLYVDLLITLQNILITTDINQPNSYIEEIEAELPPPFTLSTEQLETPLNQRALSTQYQRLIKRISTAVGNVSTVQDIIKIDPIHFSKLPAVGKLYVNQLIEFKKQLPVFLEIQTQKSALFKENYLIEFNEIDNILIEDVEGYLWSLDEMKMDIALSRWGFNQQHESLEEIGNRYKVTRERIRQLEKPINTNLPLHLTIQPKVLWANIREKMSEDLTVLLPNLAKCFATDKLFYAFIELCCQVESGSIREITMPKINNKILNPIFCTNPSPIAQEIIINELMSNYGYSKASAIHGIKQLEKNNKIEINEEGIYPKKIGKIVAVAHALTFHPAGLPWKDIARIVNKKGYSSTPFDETRTASGFHDSEFLYLCGLGTFRNLMFLDLEQFDIPEIMQNVLDYFRKNQLTTLHLHDYYYQSKSDRSEIEYYTLRHIIREYGEEYGLYFDGKSNVDGVSIDPDLKRITQADVILKVLNESKVAMTKQEIAERLRSKSLGHAGFYLNNLIEEGKVVRVDQMVYTTTEKAFGNMETKSIMKVIKDIMSISDIIVEADVFREYVNMELNLSYSKYFYAALVKTQIEELALYRNGNLFSKQPIPYKNLADMSKQLCDPELSSNQNIKVIQKAVWLTVAVATAAIQQWKSQMSH